MFTKEAQELAKPFNDALKKIAERQECPGCFGKGFYKRNANHCRVVCTRCKKCNGTGKRKWEWEPEEGDHIVLDDEVYLLFPTRDGLGYDAGISCGRSTDYSEEKYYDDFTQATKDNCIPLLHWERIEEILEGMGYGLVVEKWMIKKRWNTCTCSIYDNYASVPNRDKLAVEAPTRQLAVMRSVIALGKEKVNEKD